MEFYPDLLLKTFCPSEETVSPDMIQDLFKPLFSPKGSNKRMKEEDLVMAWIHYLQDIESM